MSTAGEHRVVNAVSEHMDLCHAQSCHGLQAQGTMCTCCVPVRNASDSLRKVKPAGIDPKGSVETVSPMSSSKTFWAGPSENTRAPFALLNRCRAVTFSKLELCRLRAPPGRPALRTGLPGDIRMSRKVVRCKDTAAPLVATAGLLPPTLANRQSARMGSVVAIAVVGDGLGCGTLSLAGPVNAACEYEAHVPCTHNTQQWQ